MATLYSDQLTTINGGDVCKANAVGGKLRVYYFSFLTTGHTSGDIVELFKVPANTRFMGGEIQPAASLGTTTVKIGWATNDDALRIQGTLTGDDTFGVNLAENFMVEVTAYTTVILTYATANPTTAITVKGCVYAIIE